MIILKQNQVDDVFYLSVDHYQEDGKSKRLDAINRLIAKLNI